MTKFREMTDREACIFSAMQFQSMSKAEAHKLYATADNKTKKRFVITDYGIYEADSIEPNKLTVSAGQQNTVRMVGKGHDIEQQFISDQMRRGDTREHAEELSKGIMCFMEDIPVEDGKGNASIETRIFYSHNAQGKKEFHKIEAVVHEEPTAYDRCIDIRKSFQDTQQAAEEYSALIMYGSNPTKTTLKLRNALESKANFFTLVNLMADWQLERLKIETAQIEQERAANKKRVTVGDLQDKSKPERITASKHPFDHNHRLTVGDLYHKRRTENVKQ